MSTLIISRGEVTIKDKLNRADRREMDCLAFAHVPVSKEPTLGQIMQANMAVMLRFIERIVIDGDAKPITQETLDNEEWITDEDMDLIQKSIETVQKKESLADKEVKKD